MATFTIDICIIKTKSLFLLEINLFYLSQKCVCNNVTAYRAPPFFSRTFFFDWRYDWFHWIQIIDFKEGRLPPSSTLHRSTSPQNIAIYIAWSSFRSHVQIWVKISLLIGTTVCMIFLKICRRKLRFKTGISYDTAVLQYWVIYSSTHSWFDDFTWMYLHMQIRFLVPPTRKVGKKIYFSIR
jgi:hypothetical protein